VIEYTSAHIDDESVYQIQVAVERLVPLGLNFEVFSAGTLWPSFHINVATDIIEDFAISVGNNLGNNPKVSIRTFFTARTSRQLTLFLY
jgi:hypothetical protein